MSVLFMITCRACGMEIDEGIVCDDCCVVVAPPVPAITVNGESLSTGPWFEDHDIHYVDPYALSDREVYGPEFEHLPFQESGRKIALSNPLHCECLEGICCDRKLNRAKAHRNDSKDLYRV